MLRLLIAAFCCCCLLTGCSMQSVYIHQVAEAQEGLHLNDMIERSVGQTVVEVAVVDPAFPNWVGPDTRWVVYTPAVDPIPKGIIRVTFSNYPDYWAKYRVDDEGRLWSAIVQEKPRRR